MFKQVTIASTITLACLSMAIETLPAQADTAEKIKASAAAIEAVRNLLSSFKPSVILEVDNETDLRLARKWDSHAWGGYVTPPKKFVNPKSAVVFGSQGKGIGGAGITGTEGSVTYQVGHLDLYLHLEWDNPTFGSNSCKAYFTGGAAAGYRAECIAGSGFQSHTTFEIYNIAN